MERGSQILKPLKGMTKLGHKWAGTDPETESEEDNIAENGTDYNGVKKGMGDKVDALKDVMMAAKDKKGDEMAAEEEEEMGPEGDEMEEEEEEEMGMEKSFADIVLANPVLVEGMESSPFLNQMVKSIAIAFDAFDDTSVAIQKSFASDHRDLAKSFDGAFEVMGSRLGLIDTTASAIDMQKSQEADSSNVSALNKGGFSDGSREPTRNDVLNAMMKSVEAGQLNPLEIIKFETTGQVRPEILKSLNV